MVQPVRLVVGISVLLSIASVAVRAAAEPVPASCRTGLVLGVPGSDAQDVVAAVCTAAKTKNVAGLVRVSVIASADRGVRVAVARLVDTSREEETAHADAPTVAGAVRIAPALVDALESTSPPAPATAPAPPPSPPPPPAPAPAPAPVAAPTSTEEKDTPSVLEMHAGPPAAMVGVHAATAIAAGETAVGPGASVGIDHESAQGFLDYSNAGASLTRATMKYELLTIGARLKLARSNVKPIVGGGWSYVDYEGHAGDTRTSGEGIGVFGELGVLVAVKKRHQIYGLGRWNVGLYRESQTRPVQYTAYDGSTYTSYGGGAGGDALTSSFSLLAGYAYVFR